MSLKFTKNRSVDESYLHVPIKYCLHMKGKNNTFDKDFVIIDRLGNNYLCGWRNTPACKVGMTFLCKRAVIKGKVGFYYKDKFIPLNNSGWVF